MRTASERGGKICIDLQNTALGVIIDPQTMLLSVRVFQKTAWQMPTGGERKHYHQLHFPGAGSMEKWRLASRPLRELSKGQNAPWLEPGQYPDSTARTHQAATHSPMHPACPLMKLKKVMPTGCLILENLPVTWTQSPEPRLWQNFITAWPGSVSQKTYLHPGTSCVDRYLDLFGWAVSPTFSSSSAASLMDVYMTWKPLHFLISKV